jgi:O-antigen ligase
MVVAFIRMAAPQTRPVLRAACAVEFAFLNCGLLLTYTRGQWIASSISLGLVCLLLPRVTQVRIARRALLAAGSVLAVVLFLFAAGLEPPGSIGSYTSALASRALSPFNITDTLASPSLQWRAFETEQAFRALGESPQGVGLGNAYRPVTTFAGEAAGYQGLEPLNRFVHNSYLYIAVKTGLPGLGAFLWFCVAFAASAWQIFRHTRESAERWLVLAVLATFVGVMQWSLTEANFMQTGSTAVVGIMVGIVGSIHRTTARSRVASPSA